MKHTAIGKVFMAYSPHLSKSIYNGVNENEIKLQENEMQDILDRGYAMDPEEYEKELNCRAVPYFVKTGLYLSSDYPVRHTGLTE